MLAESERCTALSSFADAMSFKEWIFITAVIALIHMNSELPTPMSSDFLLKLSEFLRIITVSKLRIHPVFAKNNPLG
jgi:hypothetical protein